MDLNRRQVLGGLFGTITSKIPIGNLPQTVVDILDINEFPTDIIGASREKFEKAIKKGLGKKGENQDFKERINIFLNERDALLNKANSIGQKLLKTLGANPESENRVTIVGKSPQYNIDNSAFILDRFGYPKISWEEFLQWEGRHTIKGQYTLEEGINFPCSEEGVEATGSIELNFDQDGITKVILHITKNSGTMKTSIIGGIEKNIRSIEKVQKQIFDWKSKDWSQDIIEEHKAAHERMKEEDKVKRDKKNISALKSTTSLTSPEESIENYNKLMNSSTNSSIF